MNIATFKKIRFIFFIIIVFLMMVQAYQLAIIVGIVGGAFVTYIFVIGPLLSRLFEKISDRNSIKKIQSGEPLKGELERNFVCAVNVLKDASKSVEEKQVALRVVCECANNGYKPAVELVEHLKKPADEA